MHTPRLSLDLPLKYSPQVQPKYHKYYYEGVAPSRGITVPSNNYISVITKQKSLPPTTNLDFLPLYLLEELK